MLRTGDIVKITNNKLKPEYQERIGKISKAYPTYENDGEYLYSVNINGRVIQGLARERDLKMLASSGEEYGHRALKKSLFKNK